MKNILAKLKNFMIGPEYDENEEYEITEEYVEEAPPSRLKEVTPIQSARTKRNTTSYSDKVVNIHTNVQMQVVIAQPKDVNDTNGICDHIKSNKTVLVNLENVERDETQRIVDFLSGVTYALDGDFQSISGRIFIAAPHNVDISAQFKEDLKSSGLIFPWVRQL